MILCNILDYLQTTASLTEEGARTPGWETLEYDTEKHIAVDLFSLRTNLSHRTIKLSSSSLQIIMQAYGLNYSGPTVTDTNQARGQEKPWGVNTNIHLQTKATNNDKLHC